MAIEPQEIPEWRRNIDRVVMRAVENFLLWFCRHWLAVLLGLSGLLLAGGLASPILAAAGLGAVSGVTFSLFHVICTQIPDHSYWLAGFQMALCQRDLSIFASFLLTGTAFAVAGRRWPQLEWRWYFLMLIPIAIDGGTQFLGWRSSNWWLRTFTGGLFGFANAWMILPTLEWAMKGVARSIMEDRKAKNPISESETN